MTSVNTARAIGAARRPTGAPVTLAAGGLAAAGIQNKSDLGTDAVQVFNGACAGKAYRLTLRIVTASRAIGWATVAAGAAAPTLKADSDGSADEGALITSDATGGQSETIVITDDQDVYIVASDAATAVQVVAVEVA